MMITMSLIFRHICQRPPHKCVSEFTPLPDIIILTLHWPLMVGLLIYYSKEGLAGLPISAVQCLIAITMATNARRCHTDSCRRIILENSELSADGIKGVKRECARHGRARLDGQAED